MSSRQPPSTDTGTLIPSGSGRVRGRRFAALKANGGSVRIRDLFYFKKNHGQEPAPLLLPDEENEAGNASRQTLVLVHGHYWKDGLGQQFDPEERSFLFEPFRNDPRYDELHSRYRVFTYLYPTHAGYDFTGSTLACQIQAVLPKQSGERDVTVIAHSMGGLVARHALRHQGLGGRLSTLITLATPHHGTILANMVMAGSGLRRKIGWIPDIFRQLGQRIWVASPAMQGMSAHSPEPFIPRGREEHFDFPLNHALARLNDTDPYLDRLVCLMGRVRGLWLRGRNIWDQLPRWVLGRHASVFRGLDPLVRLESGLAEGLAVRSRHALDDLDHESIVTSPMTHDLLYQMLFQEAQEVAA